MTTQHCDLCEAARYTEWYHDDDICWVAECESCSVPMVVWRQHGVNPPDADRQHMLEVLGGVADRVHGSEVGVWWLDDDMRSIPDHFHVHARRRLRW